MKVNLPAIAGLDSAAQARVVLYASGQLIHAPLTGVQMQPLDSTLTALAGLDSSAGLLAQTGSDAFAKRSLTGSVDFAITNGDGASGNPNVSLSFTVSSFAKTVLDDANATAAQSTLGLGTAAVEDYDTGTWTPTVSFATPGTSSFSYASQFGEYVVVGDMVHISCNLSFTPTIGTGSGNFLISGLPFAMNAGVEAFSLRNITSAFTWPGGRTQITVGASGTTDIFLVGQGAGLSGSVFGTPHLTNGVSHGLNFAGSYSRRPQGSICRLDASRMRHRRRGRAFLS